MRTPKFEAIAIATTDTQGRYLSKSVIVAAHSEQAISIAQALAGIEQVQATPVMRDFDVFGRMYWSNRNRD